MRKTYVTYGQLDRALRSLGFSRRLIKGKPPAIHYEHKDTGAFITVPPLPAKNRVMEHHLVSARVVMDEFGIADPTAFDATLRKAG